MNQHPLRLALFGLMSIIAAAGFTAGEITPVAPLWPTTATLAKTPEIPMTSTTATQAATPAASFAQIISPGDCLAVAFHIATADSATSYTIEPGDELYLNFRWSPELSQVYVKKLLDDEEKRRQDRTMDKISVLSRAYIVQPDGTLVLTAVKTPLKVQGLTTLQIAERVERIYKEAGLLSQPDLNVTVDPKYKRYEAFQRTIQSGGERPILHLPVPGDGRIALPLVSDVSAAGKTVKALSEELTSRYHALGLKLVTVTAWFDEIKAPGRLRILGAVKNEGAYALPEGGDLWDAIAMAGGFAPDARLSSIHIIRRAGQFTRRTVNLDVYLATGEADADVSLHGDELIFVERKQ